VIPDLNEYISELIGYNGNLFDCDWWEHELPTNLTGSILPANSSTRVSTLVVDASLMKGTFTVGLTLMPTTAQRIPNLINNQLINQSEYPSSPKGMVSLYPVYVGRQLQMALPESTRHLVLEPME